MGHPRDFYQLLRQYVPPIDIPATSLAEHYTQLLSQLPPGYMQEQFLDHGIDRAEDISADEVVAGITRLRNNKALGRSWLSADLLKQVAV